MIELRKGDLFTAGTEAIVNTVNCVGVMGRGIALEFKKRYPTMFKEYVKLCKRGFIQVGFMWIWYESVNYIPLGCICLGDGLMGMRCNAPEHYTKGPKYVINFPTKENWRNPSKLEWISAGLADLKNRVMMMGIESIAIPALGCANGGLHFEDVRPLIEEKLNDLEIPIFLYEPQ